MMEEKQAADLLAELVTLVREGPGERDEFLTQAMGTVAVYCAAPFPPLVRSNAQLISRHFVSWFSVNRWNHQGDGGRRQRDHLLSAIHRMCDALQADLPQVIRR
jgi:hypothetical protein